MDIILAMKKKNIIYFKYLKYIGIPKPNNLIYFVGCVEEPQQKTPVSIQQQIVYNPYFEYLNY